jgi:hypothetical protein
MRFGLSCRRRKPKAGPESDLVNEFVESNLPPAPLGQKRTVFLEPEIESGYPDIVAVYWQTAITRRWPLRRLALTTFDIQIAHFLAIQGETPPSRLFSFFGNGLANSIEKLHDAELVCKSGSSWQIASMRDIFAVRRIVAIEAKINSWRAGLDQAFLNTWFASESHLVLPKLPRGDRVLKETSRFGIGLLTLGQPLDSSGVVAQSCRIPKSYASWLFNEWVWKEEMRS